jgi:hypothetical protein
MASANESCLLPNSGGTQNRCANSGVTTYNHGSFVMRKWLGLIAAGAFLVQHSHLLLATPGVQSVAARDRYTVRVSAHTGSTDNENASFTYLQFFFKRI